MECYTVGDYVYRPAPPLPPSSKNLHLNLKREADLRKTYETWRILFMDANELAAGGFFFIDQIDVRCTFCGVEVCHWEGGDDALREHLRCSPYCGFAKWLCAGNNNIISNDQPEKSSDQPTRSRDMFRPCFDLRPNSLPERIKYYYLYFFCYVCVIDNSVLIFNVLLQLQVIELLNR